MVFVLIRWASLGLVVMMSSVGHVGVWSSEIVFKALEGCVSGDLSWVDLSQCSRGLGIATCLAQHVGALPCSLDALFLGQPTIEVQLLVSRKKTTMEDAQQKSCFDLLPNDVLSHVLGYCERTTETKLVCRRFYAVYAQYRLWEGLDKAFVADWVRKSCAL
jgi:hypothetical protein